MATAVSPPVTRDQLAVDIAGSTLRSNVAKARDRQVMYGLVKEALTTAGITEELRDALVDRGDGILSLIRPDDQIPRTLLLDTVVPTLVSLLSAHNAATLDQPLQLRAAIHSGLVHNDGDGWFAESLDLLFRLLDAKRLKKTLAATGAPLALVVSDDIYQSVVRQGYDGIDASVFTPLSVTVASRRCRGWVYVPV